MVKAKPSQPSKLIKQSKKSKPVTKGQAKDQKKSEKPKLTQSAKSTKENLKSEKPTKIKKPKVSDETELDDTLLADDDIVIEDIPELEEFDDSELEEIIEEDVALVSVQSVVSLSSEQSDEVILTDAEGRRLCGVRDCDQAATVESYCRYHYLLNWKRIQVRRKILADGKLERYVNELTSRYPDKFLEMIRKDLRSEKDFVAAIAELEIDESGLDSEFEDESQNFIDEVRGVTESSGMSDDDEF